MERSEGAEGGGMSKPTEDAVLELRISCICGASNEHTVPMPHGWDTRYRSMEDEYGFCPKHTIIKQFTDSQCPGCVGEWGDCPLWAAFAYSKLDMIDADFSVLERGICPKRVNGTIMFSSDTGIKDIDLRDPPVTDAGKAFAQAIREYSGKYHKASI